MAVIPGMNAIAFTREVPALSRGPRRMPASPNVLPSLEALPAVQMHRRARAPAITAQPLRGDDAVTQWPPPLVLEHFPANAPPAPREGSALQPGQQAGGVPSLAADFFDFAVERIDRRGDWQAGARD